MDEAKIKQMVIVAQQMTTDQDRYVMAGYLAPYLLSRKSFPLGSQSHLDLVKPTRDPSDLVPVASQLISDGYTVTPGKGKRNNASYVDRRYVTHPESVDQQKITLLLDSADLKFEALTVDGVRVMSLDDYVPRAAEAIASGEGIAEDYSGLAAVQRDYPDLPIIDIYLARSSKFIDLGKLRENLRAVAAGDHIGTGAYSKLGVYPFDVREMARKIANDLDNGLSQAKWDAFSFHERSSQAVDALTAPGHSHDSADDLIQRVESLKAQGAVIDEALRLSAAETIGNVPAGILGTPRQGRRVPSRSDFSAYNWYLVNQIIQGVQPSPRDPTTAAAQVASLRSPDTSGNAATAKALSTPSVAPPSQANQLSASCK